MSILKENAICSDDMHKIAAIRVRIERGGISASSVQRLVISLCVCHADAIPLDLEKLLNAPDHIFMHDIDGIDRWIDRKTHQMGGQFYPKCAA